MTHQLKKEGKFNYIEIGEGTPIIILHGLMGGLSNFDGVINYFPEKGYKVIIPELPLYTLPLLKTNVRNFAKFLKEFIIHKKFDKTILLGNSLGGHIGLLYTKYYPENVQALVITGSSGLYESSMGESYPKRGDREYIRTKTENVFYDPSVATPALVDDVYDTVNDRTRLIRTISIAKSAIRHNMGNDLPEINIPTCIIWGKNDTVTPPEVANEFHSKLPDSDLFWIDKCGHAAMMEHPLEFNDIMLTWLQQRNF
jgi:pimeloyl-ACP methyl ester carboxylesterase